MPSAFEPDANAAASADMLSEIVEDDEAIAPAPDLSAFTPKARPTIAKKHLYEQTNFRRTLIPILLTGGVLLISLGSWSQLDRAGMLGGLGTGVGVLLISLGVVLLGVGVLNMLHVKHILEGSAANG